VGRDQTVWAANASLDVSTKLHSVETRVWSELRASLNIWVFGICGCPSALQVVRRENLFFFFKQTDLCFSFAKLLQTG